MTDKIKFKLINALKKAGLSEGVAESFTDQDDSEVEKFISTITPDPQPMDIDTILKSDDFTNWLEKNGFDKLLNSNKKVQSLHDQKVGQGIKTALGKFLDKDDQSQDPPKGNDNMGNEDEIPKWFKPFADVVKDIATSKKQETVTKTASELFKKTNIPESLQSKWIKRVNPESETSIEDQVKELENEYKDVYEAANGDGTYEFISSSSASSKSTKKKLSDDDKALLQAAAKKI